MLGYVSSEQAKQNYDAADLAQKNAAGLLDSYPKADAAIGARARYEAIVAWYTPNRQEFLYTTHISDAGYAQAAETAKNQFDALSNDIRRAAVASGEASSVEAAGGGDGAGGPGGGPDPDKGKTFGIDNSTWIAAIVVGGVVYWMLNRRRD